MASSLKPRFASRTTFDALQVESGEESEEEVLDVPEPVKTEDAAPVKISKTALKKAAKAAKEARQKLKKSPVVSAVDVPAESSTIPTPAPVETVHEEPIAPPVPEKALEPPAQDIAEPVIPASLVKADLADVETPPVGLQPISATVTKPAAETEPPKPVESRPTPPKAQPVVPPIAPSLPIPNGKHASPEKQVAKVVPPEVAEQAKKRQSIITRTATTLLMIAGFIGLLLLGHVYMIMLVMLCQTLVYREITSLFSLKNSTTTTDTQDGEQEKHTDKDPWSKTLNWYFFAVTNYFLYGESIIYYFKHVVFADSQLLPFATNHRIISFALYDIGFVGFVMSLKKGYLKQQFGLFCWVHMTLLIVVVSSHFIVNNILEGLIWFWVPASLVICNDIFAYIWGMTFGRTPLIALSPKKTVEGFVGAFFSTIVFAIVWGTYFMRFDYMICPVHNLGVSAWDGMQCIPNPAFVWTEWQIWKPVAATLSATLGQSVTAIPYAPYHIHLLSMAVFASLVAPFGGFFASGFKRAFNIKDFGDSIPGHGGMTDRMDCQFLMGVFVYVYYSSLIREHHVTVGSILETIVSGLTLEEQLEVIADLRRYIEGQGISVPC